MSLPKVADAKADYAMPDGGFCDYVVSPTDPTTDATSGNPPNEPGTGGPGFNQLLVDCAGMTHTTDRCWARFTGNATTPTINTPNGYDAVWGSDSAYKPTVTHQATGHYRVQWPTTVVDALGITQTLALRKARASVEGATPYWQPQIVVVDSRTIDVYTFDTSHVANDLVGVTVLVEAG